MAKIEKRIGLVLSTGRTGTTYLCRALNDSGKGLVALQEPPPSRYIYLSANAANRIFDNASLMLRWYQRGLSTRATDAGNASYVEFNPYLCPIAEDLHLIASDLHVVHIVRDPRTWVASQINFGAYGFNRHFVDWVPFNMPGDLKKYQQYGSGKISMIQQVIWRWANFNRRIQCLDGKVAGYHRLKFEDMFSSDEDAARASNRSILQFLDLEDRVGLDAIMNRPPENKSKRNLANAFEQWTDADKRYLVQAAGELMVRYGYEDSIGV